MHRPPEGSQARKQRLTPSLVKERRGEDAFQFLVPRRIASDKIGVVLKPTPLVIVYGGRENLKMRPQSALVPSPSNGPKHTPRQSVA